jgi:hypothetical protein
VTWSYSQATGEISHDGEYIATGYAGLEPDLSKPGSQGIPFKGPLPQGTYNIGPPMADGGHMGTYVLPLNPWSGNNIFDRSGFYISRRYPGAQQVRLQRLYCSGPTVAHHDRSVKRHRTYGRGVRCKRFR